MKNQRRGTGKLQRFARGFPSDLAGGGINAEEKARFADGFMLSTDDDGVADDDGRISAAVLGFENAQVCFPDLGSIMRERNHREFFGRHPADINTIRIDGGR